MNNRRVGLWLIGALGGVGTTVALALAALKHRLTKPVSLVTALPPFYQLDLDCADGFVVGGHDIRCGSLLQTVRELHERANVFEQYVLEGCARELSEWQENIRPGTVLNTGPTIHGLAELPEATAVESGREVIERVRRDLRAFRERHDLDQVVVINVASTEPPFELSDIHADRSRLLTELGHRSRAVLPASSLYAWAALDLGFPYINFTPSLGASFPALNELLIERRTVYAGKDGKTGETLMKTVLAPMFAHRNLEVLSWVGHNIFGNRDGLVLDDPQNKASKVRTKDRVIAEILGYKPQSHVSIEYIPSLDDWKTAWDHIHFRGLLGVKMMLQFTWQGCDSVLAAPLVIDLARLTLLSQRRGEIGALRHLASFFKSPVDVEQHDFFKQFRMLEDYVKEVSGES